MIASVLLVVGLLTVANWYFDFNFLGLPAKKVVAATWFGLGAFQIYYGPTVEEIRARRDAINASKKRGA